jgi:hypothetical protein
MEVSWSRLWEAFILRLSRAMQASEQGMCRGSFWEQNGRGEKMRLEA